MRACGHVHGRRFRQRRERRVGKQPIVAVEPPGHGSGKHQQNEETHSTAEFSVLALKEAPYQSNTASLCLGQLFAAPTEASRAR